jgi:hypothetical protein
VTEAGAEAPGALRGDLAHFFPSEVLQLLQLAQANGRLELLRPGERAELFVERGRPVFARTSGPAVSTGQILVHRGLVTREALERALGEQGAHPGRRLGALLVAAGAVSEEQMQSAVNESLRRVIFGLLLWREGSFQFHPGEQVGPGEMKLDLDLDRLILDGLRQADEARPR